MRRYFNLSAIDSIYFSYFNYFFANATISSVHQKINYNFNDRFLEFNN